MASTITKILCVISVLLSVWLSAMSEILPWYKWYDFTFIFIFSNFVLIITEVNSKDWIKKNG